MTITRDLIAARNRPFAPTLELEYSGDPLPLVGAHISFQVRLYAGSQGVPLAEHGSVNFEDEAVAGDTALRVLRVFPQVTRANLQNFPSGLNQPEVGEADRYFYEIKLNYADGQQDSLWVGNFILEPGVDDT